MIRHERPARSLPTLLALAGLLVLLVWAVRGVGRQDEPTLIDGIDVLVDASRTLTAEEALTATGWRPVEGVPSFGLRPEAFWFRFELENPTPRPVERLVELSYPILDSVLLTLRHDGREILRERTGDARPFHERPLRHRNFVFPLELPPGGNTVLLRVESEGVVQVPLALWRPVDFIEFSETRATIEGGFFGVMAVMAFYNLILFFSVRERFFLYYVGHAVTITLFIATMGGFAYMHLWPQAVWWQAHAVPVVISLSVVFVSLFVISFLEIPRASGLGRLFGGLTVAALAAAGVAFVLGPTTTLLLASALSVITLLSALIASVWGWMQGNRAARFLVLAWGAFIVGSLALAFSKLGLLPSTPFTEGGMLFGSVVGVVFLSVAISERIRQERLMREEAQERAVRLEQEARAGLETAVAERTEQLQHAMVELSEANRRLEDLSTIDGLTGVFNRRTFDETLRTAWRTSAEDATTLVLLLVDIDRFKEVNDRHGHLVGDDVLRRVVAAMRSGAGDRDHLLARIGGDEFALLLLDGSVAEGTAVAAAIREALSHPGRRTTDVPAVTVSVGVSTRSPSDGNPDDLVDRADRALYRAKDAGRNWVEIAPSSSSPTGDESLSN